MAKVEYQLTPIDRINPPEKRYLEHFLSSDIPIPVKDDGIVQPEDIVVMKKEAFPSQFVGTQQQSPEKNAHHYHFVIGTQENGTLFLAPITVAQDNQTLELDATGGALMLTPEAVQRSTNGRYSRPAELIEFVISLELFQGLNLEPLKQHRQRHPIGDDTVIRIP